MICRRCHRLRSVNGARYCAVCAGELAAQERRRPAQVDPATAAVLTPSLAPPDAVPPVPPPPDVSAGERFFLPDLSEGKQP